MSQKPHSTKPNHDALAFSLPESLKAVPGWLVHRQKVPHYLSGAKRSGANGSPDDRANLATFDDALACLNNGGNYSGLGVALLPEWGIVALDFDDKNGEGLHPLAAEAERLTYCEVSPSGNGRRAFFRGSMPDQSLPGKVEVFHGSRYVTVTGNRVNTLDIEPLPAAFAEKLTKAIVGSRQPAAQPQVSIAQATIDAKTKSELRSALAAMRADDRDLWQRMGHALKTIGDDGRALWLEWSQTSDKYDPADAARVWESFHPANTGHQAVFAEAQRRGWANPLSRDGQGGAGAVTPPWQVPEAINTDEWLNSRLAPDCIVENYLYADVGTLFAPGGTGKTTLILFEAIHIVLGIPLWGNAIKKPGPVLIISAEDSREMLIARLRRIAEAMELTPDQVETVRSRIRIREDFAKLTQVIADVVVTTPLVQKIIDGSRDLAPVMIVFDPAVSFGIGESRVNDAEQGLIETARVLRNALNCCVRYIHHTGKANAREKSLDQYSGRGGSALSDGSRMVAVLQGGYTQRDWQNLTGWNLTADENALILARPKLSYVSPQPEIFIVRRGYQFQAIHSLTQDAGEDLKAVQDQIWRLLSTELKENNRHTANTLGALSPQIGLTRQQIRDAVSLLTASGRVENRKRPNGEGHGGGRYYLHPVNENEGLPHE